MDALKNLTAEQINSLEIAVKSNKTKWEQAAEDYSKVLRMLPHLSYCDLDKIQEAIAIHKDKLEREERFKKTMQELEEINQIREKVENSAEFLALLEDLKKHEKDTKEHFTFSRTLVVPLKISASMLPTRDYRLFDDMNNWEPNEEDDTEEFDYFNFDEYDVEVTNGMTGLQDLIHAEDDDEKIECIKDLIPEFTMHEKRFMETSRKLIERIQWYRENHSIDVSRKYKEYKQKNA